MTDHALLIISGFAVKTAPFYFFILLIFSPTLGLAQTVIDSQQISSPLMMMSGDTSFESQDDRTSHDGLTIERQDTSNEEERDQELSTSRRSSLTSGDDLETLNTTNDTSLHSFKNEQVALITSAIDVLKTDHPNEADLISLLELYLQRYEKVLDLRTFEQWMFDLIKEQQDAIELERNNPSSSQDCRLQIQQTYLNVLITERSILTALLADPIDLETARFLCRKVRFASSASKSTFEQSKTYLDLYHQVSKAIYAYETANSKRIETKNLFRNEKEKMKSPDFERPYYQSLHAQALKTKEKFYKVQEEFISTYGSLEQAEEFQQKCLAIRNALSEEGFYWSKAASALTKITKKELTQNEYSCLNHLSQSLVFLAQNHRQLASKIDSNNQDTINLINQLISIALQAKSAFEQQYASLRSSLTSLNPNHKKCFDSSFSLFGEAASSFSSAYNLLKDQQSLEKADDLEKQGRRYALVAGIFQDFPTPTKQKAISNLDIRAMCVAAKDHIRLAAQETADTSKYAYHKSMAFFFSRRVCSLTEYSEIFELVKALASPQLNEQKEQWIVPPPIFSLLKEAASLFEQSSDSFYNLSQIPFETFDCAAMQPTIQAAIRTENQASKLLSNIEKFAPPEPIIDSSSSLK